MCFVTENPPGLLVGVPCLLSEGFISEFTGNQSLFLIYQNRTPREGTPPPVVPRLKPHMGTRQQGDGGEQAVVSTPRGLRDLLLMNLFPPWQ